MKKLITFIFSLMFAASLIAAPWNGTAATAYAGGSGTATDPYQIATAEQLAYLASQTNTVTSYSVGLYFKLTANIDLGGTLQWTPIGINTTGFKFAGVFDGNDHLISNIFYNATVTTTNSYVGLFGYIAGATAGSAVIKNATVTGSLTAANFVGGFAGRADNVTFWNCINGASVKGSTAVSGTGTVVGGITGRLGSGSTISYCSNQGTIIGVGDYAGGIAGGASSGTIAAPCLIQYCSNSGNVSGSTLDAGGITGYGGGQLTINQCFNTASISALQGAGGGIDGYGGDATASPGTLKTIINNCYNTGNVSSNSPKTTATPPYTSGGILGYTSAKWYYTLSNCYNTGSVTNTNGAQVILGYYYTTGAPAGWAIAPSNCYFLSTLTAASSNGGIGLASTDLMAAASLLNNGQSPAVWSADATSINAGNPILTWQLLSVPALNTAVNNIEFQDLKVYSVGKTIQVDLNEVRSYDLSLYSINGSLIDHQIATQSHLSTNVSQSGLYFAKITDGLRCSVSKIIVQ